MMIFQNSTIAKGRGFASSTGTQPDLDFVSARPKQQRGRRSISRHQADRLRKSKRAPAIFRLCRPRRQFDDALAGLSRMRAMRLYSV